MIKFVYLSLLVVASKRSKTMLQQQASLSRTKRCDYIDALIFETQDKLTRAELEYDPTALSVARYLGVANIHACINLVAS